MIEDWFGYAHRDRVLERLEAAKGLWGAIPYLCALLRDGSFQETLGGGRLLLLLDEDRPEDGLPALQAFATLTGRDEVPLPSLFPWIGFVFTFPQFRGKRLSFRLIERAAALASRDWPESDYVHVSTGHAGLYEKAGFSFFRSARTVWNTETKIYRRKLVRP